MTALIKLTLNPGLWGEATAKHTLTYVRQTTNASPCNTTIITEDNTHINVLAKGRTREVESLINNLTTRCVMTIVSVEVEK